MGSTIIDYAQAADEAFAKRPLNDADALVLACLAYERMPSTVPTLEECEHRYGTVARRLRGGTWRHPIRTVREAMRAPFRAPSLAEITRTLTHDDFDVSTGHTGLGDPRLTEALYAAAATSPRLGSIQVSAYTDQFDDAEETQFAAQTMRLSDGTLVVVFRGTDDTLIGWKEDFNMAFLHPVPAQRRAARYLQRVAALWNGPIVLVGHSKGGNLAIHAAMHAPAAVNRRIVRVYSLDGPGFPADVAHGSSYSGILPRIRKIVPSSSIVGMMLHTPEPVVAVACDRDGIMQHLGFCWLLQDGYGDDAQQVGQRHHDPTPTDGMPMPSGTVPTGKERCSRLKEGRFVPEPDGLAASSREFNAALCDWLDTLDVAQRRHAVNALFAILAASGVRNLTTIMSALPKAIPAMIGSFAGLSDEDRRNLRIFANLLIKASLPRNRPWSAWLRTRWS